MMAPKVGDVTAGLAPLGETGIGHRSVEATELHDRLLDQRPDHGHLRDVPGDT